MSDLYQEYVFSNVTKLVISSTTGSGWNLKPMCRFFSPTIEEIILIIHEKSKFPCLLFSEYPHLKSIVISGDVSFGCEKGLQRCLQASVFQPALNFIIVQSDVSLNVVQNSGVQVLSKTGFELMHEHLMCLTIVKSHRKKDYEVLFIYPNDCFDVLKKFDKPECPVVEEAYKVLELGRRQNYLISAIHRDTIQRCRGPRTTS